MNGDIPLDALNPRAPAAQNIRAFGGTKGRGEQLGNLALAVELRRVANELDDGVLHPIADQRLERGEAALVIDLGDGLGHLADGFLAGVLSAGTRPHSRAEHKG